MLTKKELDMAIHRDYEKTVKELVENCDLLLKSDKMLVENRLSEEEHQVLQEGAWESVKYGLAKLGRYKVAGKGPFSGGRGKIDQETGAKIQKILDKKGNEVIKKLDDTIKKENPEFPNNKEGKKFLGTVVSIAEIYDSIVASTKKNPKEEGYLQVNVANSLIADLAEYVQKFLDVDLAAAYTVMDSEENKVGSEGELITDEVKDINEDEAADLRAKLQAKKGDEKYDTKRMGKEGLKSNRLPMTLAGIGASLGAFSWLVNTEWFKSLFTTVETKKDVVWIKETIQTKSEIFGNIDPGQGMTQLMNEMNNLGLSPSSSPEDFLNGVKQLGGGDLQSGINALAEKGGIFRDPDAARAVLGEIAKNPHGHGDTLGEIFQDKWAGTGKSMGDALVTVPGGTLKGLIVKTLVKMVPRIITTTVVKTSATYLALKGLAGVLGPIGIGLVGAGALVKIMRVKGQKQSRAKTLNDLLQSLQPIKVEGNPSVLPNKPNPVEGGGEKMDNNQLFNDLKNFFQFVVNNKKRLNIKTELPDSALVSKKEKESPCYNLNVGDEVLYKPNNGDESVFIIKSKPFTDPNSGKQVIQAQRKGNKGSAGLAAIECARIKKINENIMKNELILIEGKFIKDKRTVEYLAKKGTLDKVKKFEEFLTRLEYIRNKVKKMNNTGDKVIDNFIKKLKSNPIMATDFVKMFNVPSDNPKGVQSLKGFIDELFSVLYSGKFKNKMGLVAKMATLGSGNINKMEESYLYEDKGYNVDAPNKSFKKDAQDRGSFKKHLNNFILELMNMFQYMYKLKKQGKLSNDKSKENKPQENKPQELKAPGTKQEESFKKIDPLLNEEVNKIKNLMFRIL